MIFQRLIPPNFIGTLTNRRNCVNAATSPKWETATFGRPLVVQCPCRLCKFHGIPEAARIPGFPELRLPCRRLGGGQALHEGMTPVSVKFEGDFAGDEWTARKWRNGPSRDLVSVRRVCCRRCLHSGMPSLSTPALWSSAPDGTRPEGNIVEIFDFMIDA